jgi:hypothetical protein
MPKKPSPVECDELSRQVRTRPSVRGCRHVVAVELQPAAISQRRTRIPHWVRVVSVGSLRLGHTQKTCPIDSQALGHRL